MELQLKFIIVSNLIMMLVNIMIFLLGEQILIQLNLMKFIIQVRL